MKPESVRKAQARDDHEMLSRLGKAGGKASARKRARERAHEKFLARLAAKEEWERAVEANEHIVPIDPRA